VGWHGSPSPRRVTCSRGTTPRPASRRSTASHRRSGRRGGIGSSRVTSCSNGRAVAVAEWNGPEAGLAVLRGTEPPTWLAGSYLWTSVLADLHLRCGNTGDAERYRYLALASAPTPAVRAALERRLG
jgi:hypothetical protein